MPSSRGFATFDFAEGAATERCSVLIPEPRTESSAGTACALGWRWPIGAGHRALAVPCVSKVAAAPNAVEIRILRMTFSITAC